MRTAIALAAAMLAAPALADDQLDLRLRTQWEQAHANPDSLLPRADSLRNVQTGELRFQWDALEASAVRGVLSARRVSDGGTRATLNELSLERPLGAGFLSAGKKVMSWDVGYAFRPLDVVQQEDRRALYAPTLEGVPMLAWEWFDSEQAVSVVWSNPGAGRRAQPRDDGALALRYYRRSGTRDEYAVLRVSARDGLEGGVSFSDVVNPGLELHGSLLLQQRHTRWAGAGGGAMVTQDPGHWEAQGGGLRALAGLTWTTEGKLSIIGEAWRDTTAYSGAEWDAWRARNRALQAPSPLPPALQRANLGWQASLLQTSTLRRQNVFARVAQNFGDADLSADVLWTPEDGGRITSAMWSWKPAPWSVSASLRHFSGGAPLASLPVRWQAVVAVERAF
ncbi:hypothetical protein [Massilia sp. TS11]|uniref:hypothetical protein n=1 Tax=Massilia sp. TS11 TaxID=2908003 RepID=UPI001EDAE013|nr:hypothetical protein [Massilia sp. TS11]MCG2585698.1 hypothetical protein [Massilia sp. TS11]